MPDSPVIEGRRTIRTILVIDEAHNYLSQKNIFLQRIIREGRSKGVVVFFASQSPNDYQQEFSIFRNSWNLPTSSNVKELLPGLYKKFLGAAVKQPKIFKWKLPGLNRGR